MVENFCLEHFVGFLTQQRPPRNVRAGVLTDTNMSVDSKQRENAFRSCSVTTNQQYCSVFFIPLDNCITIIYGDGKSRVAVFAVCSLDGLHA